MVSARRARILVVDDEDFVRSLIVDVLAKVYLPTSSVSLASTLRIEALLETIGWARVPNQLTASEALSQTLTFP